MNKLLIALCVSFLLLVSSVQAADLYFDSSNTNIKTGSFFEVTLILDSQDEAINAIEGGISFPADLLDFVNIKENDSIINFWIEKPTLMSKGLITFSGIVPGGYTGKGNIFKIIFKSNQIGQDNLDIIDTKILLNNGLGTEAKLEKHYLSFSISDDALIGEDVIIIDLSDKKPPEPFTPIITKIPEIGGNKYLMVFVAQDKDSDVDYYDIKEGNHFFVKAESPYVLKNQKLDKKIIIRAVDKSGNIRTVTIAPVYPTPWYENVVFFVIILVVIILSFIFGKVLWQRQKLK